MEYLMTYGWAILIIAVVLGVLFQLGVFSSSSFSVRAPPGACQVLRTSAAVNLVGQCSGVLPQYVANFNGQSSSISLSSPLNFGGTSAFSVTSWISVNDVLSSHEIVGRHGSCSDPQGTMRVNQFGNIQLILLTTISGCQSAYSNNQVVPGRWYHVAESYDGANLKIYIDGVLDSITPTTGAITSNYFGTWIGSYQGTNEYFRGMMSNIQIYNATLSASEMQSLYSEGIGGAPVVPTKIVGWWPLNGDTKDYSGKNNNGAPISVTFQSKYGR
jgi:hypothetical protein